MTLSGTSVLVVDDDPDTREILRVMLEDAGATVATTASADETRAILGRLQPDLLIADIGMPDEDGYSLIRSVRALESDVTRRVPAIALTAHAHSADVNRALASGFQVHLAKPVESTQLVSTVAMLVRRFRLSPGADGRHVTRAALTEARWFAPRRFSNAHHAGASTCTSLGARIRVEAPVSSAGSYLACGMKHRVLNSPDRSGAVRPRLL